MNPGAATNTKVSGRTKLEKRDVYALSSQMESIKYKRITSEGENQKFEWAALLQVSKMSEKDSEQRLSTQRFSLFGISGCLYKAQQFLRSKIHWSVSHFSTILENVFPVHSLKHEFRENNIICHSKTPTTWKRKRRLF